MSDDDLPVYCICKTPDIERFMIMCDECDEWFHGDCIKITEKESKYIKYFYCKACRIKNPILQIRYRKSKKTEEKEISYKKRIKEKKRLKLKKKKSATSDVHKSASAPALSESSKSKAKYEKDEVWEPDNELTQKPFLQEKKNSSKIFCSDSENDTGITMETPAERKSSVENVQLESPKHEANNLKQNEKKKVASTPQPTVKERQKKEKIKKVSKRCEKCENCLRKEDCGVCDTCFDRQRFGSKSKLKKCRLRRCLDKKSSKKSKEKLKITTKRKPSPIPVEAIQDEPQPKYLSKPFFSKAPQTFIHPGINIEDYGLYKQCLGPGCTNEAELPSKYCSEACGRRLARNRLHQILPERIHEWNSTPTVANEQGKAELERIRIRMEQARNELTAFERKFRQLESIIAAGKSLSIDGKRADAEDENEGEADHSIYCVVCGHSVNIKGAIKHMDRCYIKIESQMSFGSVYPTRIEGSARLFCDVYNEQQQTYCKRLQVLCPEHTKEPKVSENEVCGCPLSCDIYGDNTPSKAADFCRLAKRKCNKHFKWETMYRAEVDLQRIRQWLKIDEIFDEERRIRTAMASRAGVVSLLLHQTIAHDPTCVDMRTKPTVSKKPAYRLMI